MGVLRPKIFTITFSFLRSSNTSDTVPEHTGETAVHNLHQLAYHERCFQRGRLLFGFVHNPKDAIHFRNVQWNRLGVLVGCLAFFVARGNQ